jgi:hypothetical protein
MHFGVVSPRPINTRLLGDFGFAATLQGRPYLRRHSFGSWPLQRVIRVICSIQEREFSTALIKYGRGATWSVDPPKVSASQPSPSFNDYRLTGPPNSIRDSTSRVGAVGGSECDAEAATPPIERGHNQRQGAYEVHLQLMEPWFPMPTRNAACLRKVGVKAGFLRECFGASAHYRTRGIKVEPNPGTERSQRGAIEPSSEPLFCSTLACNWPRNAPRLRLPTGLQSADCRRSKRAQIMFCRTGARYAGNFPPRSDLSLGCSARW